MVFQRFPVEGKAFVFFALAAFPFLVEASFGFVAQPFTLQHLREELRQAQLAAFVVDVRGHIANHVPQNIQPN